MAMPLLPGLLPQPEPSNNEPGDAGPGSGEGNEGSLEAILAEVDEATMMEMAEMADAAYLAGELDAFLAAEPNEEGSSPESEVPEGETSEEENGEEAPEGEAPLGTESSLGKVQAELSEAGTILSNLEQLLEAAEASGVKTGTIEDALEEVQSLISGIEEAEAAASAAVDSEDPDALEEAVAASAEAMTKIRDACDKAKAEASKQADDNKPEMSDLELWLQQNS